MRRWTKCAAWRRRLARSKRARSAPNRNARIDRALRREASMQLGMIGLGKMGGNMVRRLQRGGHACVVYDRVREAVDALAKDGARGASTLADFVKKLERPRAICLM